jgi:hypothetical protein
MISANAGTNDVSVFLGMGNGNFQTQVRFAVGSNPISLALGDVNGDGNLDVVTANQSSDDVSVLLGLGDGNFSIQGRFPIWDSPNSVALKDINGDGLLDIISANQRCIALLLNMGGGCFLPQTRFAASSQTTSVAVEDIDQDGFQDIALSTMSTNTLSVLLQSTLNVNKVLHTPKGYVVGPIDKIEFHFPTLMDTSSFSPQDDLVSFTGPQGSIAVEDYTWLDGRRLEVGFSPQYAVGPYQMVIGPYILNGEGVAMDSDQDGIPGELPDDQYVAGFIINAPRIYSHLPIGETIGPVQSLFLNFDHPMDQGSFSLEDILSFTGPNGGVVPTGDTWITPQVLEVIFEPQTSAGLYRIVIGPQVLDTAGNPLDQDFDFVPGEESDDQYIATFTIMGPRVISSSFSIVRTFPFESIELDFNHPMDQSSFSPAEDIESLNGPEGPIEIKGYRWVDSDTLELTFDPQWATGIYRLAIGPQILDVAGNPMDQDDDHVVGEEPDDRFRSDVLLAWSGTLQQDTTWTSEHGVIIVDGLITIPAGVTLNIEPGTIIKFTEAGGSGFTVEGTLEVNGTHTDPVVFTSFQDDTAGGDTNGDGMASIPGPGDWIGLTFSSDSAIGDLKNVRIRYADKAVEGTAGGAHVELRNSVLEKGRYGVYVYTPYVEIEGRNCLIVDNIYTGIFVRADSREVFRNCTIVGNGFQGVGWDSAGIHLGGANLTLENTIVAFNRNGLDHSGDPPSLTIHNCDFYNPDGQEIIWNGDPGMPQLNQNGNVTSDPLFVDRSAGNYELAAGSPAVDSGCGIRAPDKDILDRPRYDDKGMPNRGTGLPSYVDMGAFERQEDTLSSDLAIVYISDPTPEVVSSGESFTFGWTVVNIGLLDAVGSWKDVVYLSSDPYLSNDDDVLEQKIHEGPLTPGESYTEVLTATVPELAGPYYVIVRANAERTLNEPLESNNVMTADRVLAIDMPVLTLDNPVTGTLHNRQWTYYRFDADPGNTVVLNLESSAQSGSTGLYVRYGLPPTLNKYDLSAASPNSLDQQLRILSPFEGTYYVGLYGTYVPTGSMAYTISAALTHLDIRALSPNTVGNGGCATIKIEGDNFTPEAQVQLVSPEGKMIDGQEYYQDSATLFATFDLAAAKALPGLYDVIVINTGTASVIEPDAVMVGSGGIPQFQASITMPGVTRPGRVIEVRIDYSNPGIIDVPSPILTLDSGVADCEWQLPGRNTWIRGPDFDLMGISSDGPVTVLRPHQTETLIVSLKVPFRPDPITVSLLSVGAVSTDGSNNPINWIEFENDVRPEGLDPSIWDPVFARLKSQIGSTWGDYAEVLRQDANRWFAAGRRTPCVRELFGMEMDEAYGRPTGILAGHVEDSESGLPLANAVIIALGSGFETLSKGTTNEQGAFFLYGVKPGEVTISVSRQLVQSGGTLQMPEEGDLVGQEITVFEAGHVSGRVLSEDKNLLIPGGIITIYGTTSGFSITTMADENGRYEFSELPADIYNLECTARGYSPFTGGKVVVTLGTTVMANIHMLPGGKISGAIIDLSQISPINDARVLVQGQDTLYQAEFHTNVQGEYIFSGLPADRYVIEVSHPGYATEVSSEITITPGSTIQGMNIGLQVGASIQGHLYNKTTGQPIVTDDSVVMVFSAETVIGFDTVDEQGGYSIDGMRAGDIHSGCGFRGGCTDMDCQR